MEYCKDDVVVSKGFKLYSNCTPFRKVLCVGTTKKSKRKVVRLYGNTTDEPIESYRLATKEDYDKFNTIKDSISFISTEDDKQHISSVTGESKVVYINEEKAFNSAFKMCEKKGGNWIVYTCKVCNQIHIGKNND